jgi:hypothetical protein
VDTKLTTFPCKRFCCKIKKQIKSERILKNLWLKKGCFANDEDDEDDDDDDEGGGGDDDNGDDD